MSTTLGPRPTSATRPDGGQINATYDSAGRLARITDSDGTSDFGMTP
ncbi:MAG: RHS repeat protein [Actinobacteria bacterium]|nr:RHS repeat protein [Actinomycetota bacterium]